MRTCRSHRPTSGPPSRAPRCGPTWPSMGGMAGSELMGGVAGSELTSAHERGTMNATGGVDGGLSQAGGLEEQVPDVAALRAALDATGYLADDALATALFLASRMGQPILLEGEPGVGKTEAAKALAQALATPMLRLPLDRLPGHQPGRGDHPPPGAGYHGDPGRPGRPGGGPAAGPRSRQAARGRGGD